MKIHSAKNFYVNTWIIASNCKFLIMRNCFILLMLLFITLTACSPSGKSTSPYKPASTVQDGSATGDFFKLTVVSDDDTYGYSEKNPIKVGGAKNSSGPANERKFLNALLGPDGQIVTYVRTGSCCMFKTPHGLMGAGLLDKYEVKYEGLENPVILYINMYDKGDLKAPKGFTFRQ